MGSFFNGMLDIVTRLLKAVISLLPTSPFADWIDSISLPDWVGWLNWFFPVGPCMSVMALWLTSVALYYAYSVVMRWVKIIG